jgi:hypothetical protein
MMYQFSNISGNFSSLKYTHHRLLLRFAVLPVCSMCTIHATDRVKLSIVRLMLFCIQKSALWYGTSSRTSRQHGMCLTIMSPFVM